MVALAFLAALAVPSLKAKPNFLLIVADDLGYADIGFNGGTVVATPNLDRLAATGVTFTDFRVCPLCSPTRAGLLTGRWPLRFGMMRTVVPPWSQYGLPAEENTLPELLAAAGYERRGIVGKWHLGHARREFLPLQQGFTRFVGCYNGAINYFTHERNGERDWHEDERPVKVEGYATDLIAKAAVEFIKESPIGKPWLLYVPFTAPHAPYQAKPQDLEKYKHIEPREKRAYAAMIDALDQAVGRILATVEGRDDADDTIILFFSDNGGIPRVGASNVPFRGAKSDVYEGGTRVCAAMRWPAGGVKGGGHFAGRVGYIDVLPTFLAAAEVDVPSTVDGIDFLPALAGEKTLPERLWFSFLHHDRAQASVHDGEWKLVAHGDVFSKELAADVTLELYHLARDLAETKDVAAEHPGIVARLRDRLVEFGRWGRSGVSDYTDGRQGFVPPKDWVISR